MTREEFRDKKSKDYRKRREDYGIKDPVFLDEIEEAYYQGMVDADKYPRWISVEDELPPRDTFFNISNIKIEDIEKYGLKDRELDTSISCLVAICGGMLGLANYNYKEKAWSTACCDEVTHWMPMPQAPIVAKNATVKKGDER